MPYGKAAAVVLPAGQDAMRLSDYLVSMLIPTDECCCQVLSEKLLLHWMAVTVETRT